MSLAGCHVVITRAADEQTLLHAAVSTAGGTPVAYPCVTYQACPAPATEALQEALNALPTAALLFTSRHAVAFFAAAHAQGLHTGLPQRRIVCVGTASATAVAQLLQCTLADDWPDTASIRVKERSPVIWPTSTHSAPEPFPARWNVRRCPIYTSSPSIDGSPLSPATIHPATHIISVFSGSAVHGFVQRFQRDGFSHSQLRTYRFVALGDHARRALAQYDCPHVTPCERADQDVFLCAVIRAYQTRLPDAP